MQYQNQVSNMEEKNQELTDLNRHQLGLIDVEDLKDPIENLDQNERKEYVANIAMAYALIEGELKNAIAKQANFTVRMAESWEKVLIGRGGINMGELLLDRFKNLKAEHTENVKPPEEFDPHEVV